jgi:hypothetical protein
MSIYKVNRIEAEKFSKIWNKGGISILLSPEAIDFATDFSNVVLNNFIHMCQEQVVTAKQQESKKQIIVEGI